MVALMVTVWVIGVEVPWLVPVAVKVMGKVPVVMGMKWSGPQAVVAEARIASRVRERSARRVVRRFLVRPKSDSSVRGKRDARTTRLKGADRCVFAVRMGLSVKLNAVE
jgi:hypothetical protein